MPGEPMKIVSAAPLAITAVGSSTIGDQAGNAIADIFEWLTKLACHCDLPSTVVKGYHTLFVLIIVTIAMIIHIKLAKPQGGDQ